MSVNASLAYDSGEMPLSKWNRNEILSLVGEVYGEKAGCHCALMTLEELRRYFLDVEGYHHTGKYFNETIFYSFNKDLELWEVLGFKHTEKIRIKRSPIVECWGLVSIDVWTGTRKHPKKEHHCVVANWKERDGIREGLADCGQYGGKRDIAIAERLNGKPRKNAKVWSKCY